MFKKTSILVSLIALGACAYTMDKEFQPLTIRTPGAKNAVCMVNAANINYKFYPPQTRNIKKSNNDVTIDCMAPGNRERRVVIRPNIEDSFYGNVVNGMVPGGAVDYASEAMFGYPDVVNVDFSHAKPRPMPLPAHNYEDTLQPESYYLEEFRPGAPSMNADKFEKPIPLLRRAAPGSAEDSYSDEYHGAGSGDKGDLMRVMNALDRGAPAQSNATLGENDGGLPSSYSVEGQSVGTVNEPVPLTPSP